WTIYNSTRFVHPVLLSAQFDPLLSSANCDSTYYGEFRGYFDINCSIAIAKKEGLTLQDDESQEDVVYHRAAVDYINVDTVVEGRSPHWISQDALYSFWLLALLSIGGAVALRRRAHAPPLYPL